MTAPAIPVASKGTTLQAFVSSAYVSVAGVISIDLPKVKTETYESDTLANASAGIPYASTGRSEGGSCSGELWLDPTLTNVGQLTMGALLATPAIQLWQVKFGGNPFTSPWPAWQFSGAGLELGGKVALKEGIKGDFSIKLSGIPAVSTTAATG